MRNPVEELLRVVAAPVLSLLVTVTAAGCATGHGAAAAISAPELAAVQSGFLTNYSKLVPSREFADIRVFRDDAAVKEGFRKVLFRPVQVWRGADRRLDDIPDSDLQYLADAFYRAMIQPLRDDFEIADKPGPGVLEISMAFTLVLVPNQAVDYFSADVPVPQELDRPLPMSAATQHFIRDCAMEMEFAEARPAAAGKAGAKAAKSKRVVRAAFLDDRRASETPKGTVKTWADLDNVLAKWSQGLDDQLQSLRNGTWKPVFTEGGPASASAR